MTWDYEFRAAPHPRRGADSSVGDRRRPVPDRGIQDIRRVRWQNRVCERKLHIVSGADAVARSAVGDLSRGQDDRRLEAANRLRHAADALVTEFVVEARESGATWAEIGDTLGVSTQAAHQKYRYVGTEDE